MAETPDIPPSLDAARIARINEVSAMARTSWLTLLAYLAFVTVTLFGVEDVDFFVDSRQTQLPLVNVSIPTESFFWAASPLGAALYIYLQIILIKLWDAVGDLKSPEVDGHRAADLIAPWLANDLALVLRGGDFVPDRPLRYLGLTATVCFVWLAGPVALGYAWWRSMPAHDEWLTLWLGFWFALALCVGFESAFTAWLRLVPRAGPKLGRGAALWMRLGAATVLILEIALLGWDRTEGGRTLSLAPTDLRAAEMVVGPTGLRDFETARRAYREAWCKREGFDMAVCGQPETSDFPVPDYVWKKRQEWCDGIKIAEHACRATFAEIDDRFEEEWKAERRVIISSLPKLMLEAKDLRRASALGVTLTRADLRRARLEDADLRFARLEGADLRGAHLKGAKLRWANLEGARLDGLTWEPQADLFETHMEGAHLNSANLASADLRKANLHGADLEYAILERADLSAARMDRAELNETVLNYSFLREASMSNAYFVETWMEGADLSFAILEGADILDSHLNGANLIASDFRKVDWLLTEQMNSPAYFADFRTEGYLLQSQIESLIGNDATLLPDRLNEDGEPYYVWSCWETPPEGFDAIVAMAGRFLNDADRAQLRQEFLCQHRPRRQVGTPWPLDKPRP